jgi:hypothetical protein
MGTGLTLIFAATHRPADGMRRITLVIQHQVGMAAFAIKPAADLRLLRLQKAPDNHLRRRPIGISRCRGNVPFASQPPPQLVVGAADMLLQGVTTCSFILR